MGEVVGEAPSSGHLQFKEREVRGCFSEEERERRIRWEEEGRCGWVEAGKGVRTIEGKRKRGEVWFRMGQEGEGSVGSSATLPHFDCLVDAACNHIGGALVEI